MRLFDAHVHLHDSQISHWLNQLLVELPQAGLEGAVVNGTNESDWDAVAQLANRTEWVVPSFGLHPWWVGTESPDWLDRLEQNLLPILTPALARLGCIDLGQDQIGTKK
jgi:TatD DNase family protein